MATKQESHYPDEWNQAEYGPFCRTVVYVLRDPETLDIRYVGSTTKAMERKRSHQQFKEGKPRSPVQEWCKSLNQKGTPPLFQIVAEVMGDSMIGGTYPPIGVCARTEVQRIETSLIQQFLSQGCSLLNAN